MSWLQWPWELHLGRATKVKRKTKYTECSPWPSRFGVELKANILIALKKKKVCTETSTNSSNSTLVPDREVNQAITLQMNFLSPRTTSAPGIPWIPFKSAKIKRKRGRPRLTWRSFMLQISKLTKRMKLKRGTVLLRLKSLPTWNPSTESTSSLLSLGCRWAYHSRCTF